MSRFTTVLALVQTLLVILSFVTLGIVLKIHGCPDLQPVRWNPLTLFLRKYGVWLLVLPVLWLLLDLVVQRHDIFRLLSLTLGIILAAAIQRCFFKLRFLPSPARF